MSFPLLCRTRIEVIDISSVRSCAETFINHDIWAVDVHATFCSSVDAVDTFKLYSYVSHERMGIRMNVFDIVFIHDLLVKD